MKNIIDSLLHTKRTSAEDDQRSSDFEQAGQIAGAHGKVSALRYLFDRGYIYISDSDRFDYRVGLNTGKPKEKP